MNTPPPVGDALARLLDTPGTFVPQRRIRHGLAAARQASPFPPTDNLLPALDSAPITILDNAEATVWLAAAALADWDRPESPTDVYSRQEQLLRALVLAGRIADLLRDDPRWVALTTTSRSTGGRLADAIVGYEWAVSAPGGLRAAARLCGSPVLFAVWCDEPWWLVAGDLDPLYSRHLAGQPVANFVRNILTAADETLSSQGRFVRSSTTF